MTDKVQMADCLPAFHIAQTLQTHTHAPLLRKVLLQRPSVASPSALCAALLPPVNICTKKTNKTTNNVVVVVVVVVVRGNKRWESAVCMFVKILVLQYWLGMVW